MTSAQLIRRCAFRAAVILAATSLCLAPASGQRPMMGYEPPHKRAERLRAAAAARSLRPPAMTRERARGASPAATTVGESFWGEPIQAVTFQAEVSEDFYDAPIMDPGDLGEGMIVDEPPPFEGHPAWDECDACAGGSHCGSCSGCVGCFGCQAALNWVEAFAGAHGFTGPMNLGQTASFGFHEGVNVGLPFTLLGMRDVSVQLGARVVHSNISAANFTPDERTQVFLTGGMFRRVDEGYQYGVVLDYMHDQWYHAADLVQLRGELSYLWSPAGEIGFWMNASTQRASVPVQLQQPGQPVFNGTQTYEATDIYAFFLRRRFGPALTSTARLYTGFSGNNDGLLGADMEMPLNPGWAIQSGFTYLIPAESRATGFAQESWNVFFGVVWRPRGFAMGDYHRPLFRVADNGSFMVDLVNP